MENLSAYGPISIFSLQIYIFRLQIRIFNLQICIFRLKIEIFCREMKFTWAGNGKSPDYSYLCTQIEKPFI